MTEKKGIKPQALTTLTDIANDPYGRLADLKKKKRIIGSTLADVPEELIHAAGLHPFLILGTNEPIRHSAALLPDNSCSLARSNLELVVGYQRAFFDGFILSQVCDTTQHLCETFWHPVRGPAPAPVRGTHRSAEGCEQSWEIIQAMQSPMRISGVVSVSTMKTALC
jgi:hypothetical protein